MGKVIVAIDGPAGAGKSTVAKALSKAFGLRYLDTGAIYRCVAVKATRLGVDLKDVDGLAAIAADIDVAFTEDVPPRVIMDGEDVTEAIREHSVSNMASVLSEHSPVRAALIPLQRRLVGAGGVVLEGRDTTTKITPYAAVKIYLTASLEARTQRRKLDLEAKHQAVDFDKLRIDIQERDTRDITRADSPLAVAPGAVILESGELTAEQVIARIGAHIEAL